MNRCILRTLLCVALATLPLRYAQAHDIYTGVHDKTGQLCCGGSDCAATLYRESGGHFEFLTREQRWVEIPEERITFLPIPGDKESSVPHRAHLCYRAATESDRLSNGPNVFEGILLYCVFIPPGAI
jgi:hypothetical protein